MNIYDGEEGTDSLGLVSYIWLILKKIEGKKKG